MNTYTYDTKGKIAKDTTISLFSDLHFGNNSDKRMLKVISMLEKTKPDYIFLLGDIIQDTNLTPRQMDKLYHYLSFIETIAPVYSIYGNHDQQTKINGNWTRNYNEDYAMLLNDAINVLDNESIILDENIGLTGVTLPYGYYNISHEDSELYQKLLNEYISKKIIGKLDNQTYNILLQHTPNNISNREIYIQILKKIKKTIGKEFNFDLVISGHLHNGLVPSYVDRIIPGNRGIIGITGDKKVLFKDGCRGTRPITDKTDLIILPAVSSLPEYRALNAFFPVTNKTLVLKK